MRDETRDLCGREVSEREQMWYWRKGRHRVRERGCNEELVEDDGEEEVEKVARALFTRSESSRVTSPLISRTDSRLRPSSLFNTRKVRGNHAVVSY